MFIRRGYDKILVPVLAVGLFLYVSIRSEFRLRTEMPQQFVDQFSAGSARKGASEEQIARAYWTCATTQIQWKYSYGYHLPQDPPAEFAVTGQGLGTDDASRARYWRKLQEVWYLPSAWSKQYEWDFTWLNNPLKSAGTWLEARIRQLSP